jgi:hypothetical protein
VTGKAEEEGACRRECDADMRGAVENGVGGGGGVECHARAAAAVQCVDPILLLAAR